MPTPTSFAIAPATPDKLPDIQAIVEAAYRPYVALNGLVPAPLGDDYAARLAHGQLWVLTEFPAEGDEGQIAGLLVLIEATDHLLLENIAIHPKAQGCGYGSELMSFAEKYARWAGFSTIRLYTQEIMSKNIAIYTARGYVETHHATTNGLPRIHMEKRL